MAPRASSDDACLICEQAPCECRKAKPRSKPSARTKPVTQTVIDIPLPDKPIRQSAIDKIRARLHKEAETKRFALPVEAATSSVGRLSEEEAATVCALRILSAVFEIDGPEVDKYKKYLDQPSTIHERAAHWKLRRKADEA